jgi:hypothetical protein
MALEIRKEDIREDEPKNKIEYQSFSLSLSYENKKTWDFGSTEFLPIHLERHPCIYARLMYRLSKKFIEWLNNNNKKYAVTLDGNYIERD